MDRGWEMRPRDMRHIKWRSSVYFVFLTVDAFKAVLSVCFDFFNQKKFISLFILPSKTRFFFKLLFCMLSSWIFILFCIFSSCTQKNTVVKLHKKSYEGRLLLSYRHVKTHCTSFDISDSIKMWICWNMNEIWKLQCRNVVSSSHKPIGRFGIYVI